MKKRKRESDAVDALNSLFALALCPFTLLSLFLHWLNGGRNGRGGESLDLGVGGGRGEHACVVIELLDIDP